MTTVHPGFVRCPLPYCGPLGLDDLLPQFDGVRLDPDPISDIIHHTIRDQSGALHWQYYPYSNLYISRNLNRNFSHLTRIVADYIDELKDYWWAQGSNDPLVTKLLQHCTDESHVTLLWIPVTPQYRCEPHTDHRRAAVNIGLRNSSCATTVVGSSHVLDTWDSQRHCEFTLEDGTAYLLNTHRAHCVTGNVTRGTVDRYLISYCIP